jgi:hypothetical protein
MKQQKTNKIRSTFCKYTIESFFQKKLIKIFCGAMISEIKKMPYIRRSKSTLAAF